MWQTMQPLTLFLVKLCLSISTLWLGTFITLILVIRAYNAKAKSHAAEIEAIRNADKNAEDFMAQQINYPQNGIV
jgi:hypothetical protein